MALITAKGRIGRIRDRTQAFNPLTKLWVESNTQTGKFINVKADGKPFKAVRRFKAKK